LALNQIIIEKPNIIPAMNKIGSKIQAKKTTMPMQSKKISDIKPIIIKMLRTIAPIARANALKLNVSRYLLKSNPLP
jgi:hypothetical protein